METFCWRHADGLFTEFGMQSRAKMYLEGVEAIFDAPGLINLDIFDIGIMM